jgi:hypothetical protein
MGRRGKRPFNNRIIPGDYSDEEVILVDCTCCMIGQLYKVPLLVQQVGAHEPQSFFKPYPVGEIMPAQFRHLKFSLRLAVLLAGVAGTFGSVSALTWTAPWISYNNSETIPIFRLNFTVAKPLSTATAYVCGLGLHEFHINGQKVGTNVQEPLWTTYSKKCFYVTYNVTPLLTQGQNAMGVMLGNGFYNVSAASIGTRYTKYTGTDAQKKMTLMLVLNYTDGTTTTIVSDSTWRAAGSPITFSSIYGGEDYDARLEQPGWDMPGFADSTWVHATICAGPGGTLTAQYGQPVQVRRTWTAGAPTALSGGAWEYNLGQNIAGVPVITVQGSAGQTVKLSFRELFSSYGWQSNASTYCQYTLKGNGTETWSPRFFYYGFQFVKVQGASPTADTISNPDVALNKAITASSSYTGGGWSSANVVDGITGSSSGSMGWSSSNSLTTNHTEWIIVNLGSLYQIHEVDLYPRNDAGNVGYGFPINFLVQISPDSITWTTVATETGYAMPSGGTVQQFAFSAQNIKYVKVQGTSLRANPNESNYYRMQFAELEALSNQTTLPVTLSVQGNEQNCVTASGSFTCSDTLWNREHYIIGKAIEGNMQAVATDCPHREKLGWLEESHLIGPSVMYNYAASNFYHKIFDDMNDAQLTTGLVPDIAPEYTVFANGFRDSPEWGSASVIGPWNAYQFYGDTTFLSGHYAAMKAYVNYLTGKSSGYLLNYGLCDWYGIDLTVASMIQLVPSSIYYYDATVMAQTASVLRNTADSATWATLASNIKTAYNNALFNAATNSYATGDQCALAMPLALGIVPAANKAAVLANLVARIKSDNYRAQVGEIGNRFVYKALYDNYRSDIAASIASQTTSPSYGYLANSGRTTLTESMAGDTASSQFHMMWGHIDEWFYRAVLGIAPNKPGYAQILFNPQVAGTITSASGSVQTMNGPATSGWSYANKIFDQDITIPQGSTGLVFLPSVGSPAVSAVAYAGTSMIWNNNAATGSVPGVTFDSTADTNYLVWTVASGAWHFRVGPPGTPPPTTRAIAAPAAGNIQRFTFSYLTARFSFNLAAVRRVGIIDLAGRVVREIPVAAHTRSLAWDGRSAGGVRVTPGVYLVNVLGEGGALTRSMLVK